MTTPTQTHPSLEDLAAFFDGKLQGEDRVRVIQHLDECPDCYETFAETARFLEEEAQIGEPVPVPVAASGRQGGRVVAFPLGGADRKSWPPWLAAAAAVILVAGLAGTGYLSFFAPPRMKAEELVRPLEEDGKVQTYPWEVTRGGGDEAHSSHLAASFLIGAWIVDRQLAIDLNEADSAQDLSRRIYLALADAGMDPEYKPFQREAETRLTPAQTKAFLAKLRQTAREREGSLEKDNTTLDTHYLLFGKWTEAARLAAAQGNAEFFADRDIRRFPSYFLRAAGSDLDAEVRKSLQQIQEILAAGPQPQELPRLERLLGEDDSEKGMTGIIDFYERKSQSVDDLPADDFGR